MERDTGEQCSAFRAVATRYDKRGRIYQRLSERRIDPELAIRSRSMIHGTRPSEPVT